MLASYLLNPNRPEHSLESVSLEYLHHKKNAFTKVLGKRSSFAEVPVNEATMYAAEDAELTFELKEILFRKLDDEGLASLYFDIEMPLIYVLADIEEAGIKVDTKRLDELSKELERELAYTPVKDIQPRGRGLQYQLAEATVPHPLRCLEAEARQKDEDRFFDEC